MHRHDRRPVMCLSQFLAALVIGLNPSVGLAEGRVPVPYPYADGRAPDFADRDLDGVPDEHDNCPDIANEPEAGGQQPMVCGAGLAAAQERYVFLTSRTFRPPRGVDPGLHPAGGRMHVFLHIERDDNPVVLSPEQRRRLESAGVTIREYVPHNTYYATVPGTRTALAGIVDLPFVHGISAIQPRDRIARSVRLARGAPAERQPDGSLQFAVEFFPDAPPQAVARLLSDLGLHQTLRDEEERFVEVRSFADVLALAESDLVYWIDELPGEFRPMDDLAAAETMADIVDREHGLRGNGLKVAMMEQYEVAPGHPDIEGRVIHDSAGSQAFDQHNLEVAGIMIGDGTLDPTKRGFLPEATLIDYSARSFPRTSRHRFFRFPKKARNDHDAVLFNYSVGTAENCHKLGAYEKDGKNIDKSVYQEGISVVRAVGNSRGPDGDLANNLNVKNGPCETNLGSLRQGVAKNDVAVGNWSLILDYEGAAKKLHTTSAAGPTVDGRLKPDLVAPGSGVWTTTLGGASPFGYREFGGTSAAAPVVSGVMGQVYEAFGAATQPLDPLTVPPATVKAILLHTARDVGPPGPDYFHGWGLVDAAAAVRVALNHDKASAEDALFVYRGRVDEASLESVLAFEVAAETYGLKVTLVWDDPHAASSASLTLVNDLDLKVTDPNGVVNYYPLDTRLLATDPIERENEALLGGRACEHSFWLACRDDRNNVEQVIAADPNGGPLAAGTWLATVSSFRLGEPEQSFSLVVEAEESPARFYRSAALAADASCPYDPLAPFCISIEADDVVLACDPGVTVTGAGNDIDGFLGQYAGIRTSRDRVTVRDCTVEDFDVGVDFQDNADGRIDNVVAIRSGTAGIRVTGERHGIWESTVSGVANPDGYGITATGDQHVISGNTVVPQAPRIGIHLAGPNTGAGAMVNNSVNGSSDGIWIDASNAEGIDRLRIERNGMGSLSGDGIRVTGKLTNSAINGNVIEGFGTAGNAGIRIEATPLRFPDNNTVSGNTVHGAGSGSQTGIALEGDRWRGEEGVLQLERVSKHQVFANFVGDSADVTVGVYEDLGESNQIYGNIVRASTSGIVSANSLADQEAVHVHANNILGATTGVALMSSGNPLETASGKATSNSIREASTGISVTNIKGSPDIISVSGNTISEISVGGTGIGVSKVDKVDIVGNDIINPPPPSPPLRIGVGVDGVVDLTIVGNEIRHVEEHGVEIGDGVVNLVFTDNIISVAPQPNVGRALDAEKAADLDFGNVVVRCNDLAGGEYDAIFLKDVDTSFNAWSELGLLNGQIDDNDGDGYGEAGADWMFSSTDYAGPRSADAKQSSVQTSRISDDAPWMTTTIACPPP